MNNRENRNRLLTGISLLALLLLIWWYLSDTSRRQELFLQISSVGLVNFALITIGTFFFIFFQGFVLRHSVRPYGVDLKFLEHFGIIIVTFFSNYIIPFLGFGIRGVYLKKVHNLSYKNFSQSLIAVLIVEWTIFALIAIGACFWLAVNGNYVSPLIALLMLGIISGFVFVMLIRPSWIPSGLPLAGFVKSILEDWQSYTQNRRAFLFIGIYTFLEALGFVFAFVIAYKVLFPQVPVAASIVASSLSDLALIIRILPASAGSLEGALHLAMSPYDLSFGDNLSVALITRAALAIIFLPLGPIFFWWLVVKNRLKSGEPS